MRADANSASNDTLVPGRAATFALRAVLFIARNTKSHRKDANEMRQAEGDMKFVANKFDLRLR